MYRAYLNDTCILDAGNDILLEDAVLKLEDNQAGSFDFTIRQNNPGYKDVPGLLMISSAVKVLWENEILFKGRILSCRQNWDKSLTVETEGDLALLDDTIQRPAEYHEMTVRGLLETYINLHNAKAGSDKQFTVGAVTVTDSNDSLYRYTNWQSTLASIKDDFLDKLGGHIRIRYDGDTRILDYLQDYPRVSDQKIEFGANLLDYSENTDSSEIATVCIPLGAKKEESEIEALEERLTIESENNGSDELSITEAVNAYGRITKTVVFDDVHIPANLKTKGLAWLTDKQYSDISLELSAVDLADFGIETDHLRLLDEVICSSQPHGMHRRFPITSISLNLLEPDQNIYKLGSKEKRFSTTTRNAQYQALKSISDIPSKNSILQQALENAAALINMYGNDGHVVVTNNEIYVMDADNKDDAVKVWRWNLGGLGYSHQGYQGPFDLAITMDGTIAGRFIAAGTISAEQISMEYTSAQEQVWRNELDENYWTSQEITTSLTATDGYIRGQVHSIAKAYTDTKLEDYWTSQEITTSLTVENGAIRQSVEQIATGIFNSEITDYYTKAQIDATINGITQSFETSTSTSLTNYYTKAEIDLTVDGITSGYQTYTTNALGSYYTKSEINQTVNGITTNYQNYTDDALGSYYTKTEINQTVNGITSSYENYTDTALGSYYTKTEINQTVNGIESAVNSKVGNSEFGTKIQQSATDIKIAWNNISQYIQLEDAKMNIYDSNRKIFSLGSTGMRFWYGNSDVGHIGAGRLAENESIRGLTFNLEPVDGYMAWACKDHASDSYYTMKLTYTNTAFDNYLAGRLNLGCNIHLNNYWVANGNFQGYFHYKDGNTTRSGKTTATNVFLPAALDGDGKVTSWYEYKVMGGILVDGD